MRGSSSANTGSLGERPLHRLAMSVAIHASLSMMTLSSIAPVFVIF